MELKNDLEHLDALVASGNFIAAIEQFFDDHATAHSHPGDLVSGKHNKIEAMQAFLRTIDRINQIALRSQAVGNDVTMSEFSFDFTQLGGQRLIWNEIIHRTWADGKVVAEKYYSCECNRDLAFGVPAVQQFETASYPNDFATEYSPVEESIASEYVEIQKSHEPFQPVQELLETTTAVSEDLVEAAPASEVESIMEVAVAIEPLVETEVVSAPAEVMTELVSAPETLVIPEERLTVAGILAGENVLVMQASVGEAIPDNNAEGLVSNIEVDAKGYVEEMGVYIDIQHSFVGDLVVKLYSPSGKEVTLHNRQDGSRDNITRYYTNDFFKSMQNELVKGNWSLKVWDHATRDMGKLETWRLHLLAGKMDDLKVIEGVGPAIEKLLQNGGIWSFQQLADSSVERLREILVEAGSRYKMHDPTTWCQQAAMAADGQFQALYAWQDELKAGKVAE